MSTESNSFRTSSPNIPSDTAERRAKSPEDIRVACCLSDAEFLKRVATLLARFESAVIATEELPDGYVFQVPGDKKWMGVVWEAILAERECCPFLRFELTAQPNMGPVSVRVTGPAGTKDFLKTVLCKPDASI